MYTGYTFYAYQISSLFRLAWGSVQIFVKSHEQAPHQFVNNPEALPLPRSTPLKHTLFASFSPLFSDRNPVPGKVQGRPLLRGDPGRADHQRDAAEAAADARQADVRRGDRGEAEGGRGAAPLARGQKDGRLVRQDGQDRGSDPQEGRAGQGVQDALEGGARAEDGTVRGKAGSANQRDQGEAKGEVGGRLLKLSGQFFLISVKVYIFTNSLGYFLVILLP